jgi:hypothetical protein
MTVMGENSAAEAYLIAHPSMYTPSTVEAAIKVGATLVQMEVTASPAYVGLPIDTAVVSSRGIWWGTDNVYCKDPEKARLRKK